MNQIFFRKYKNNKKLFLNINGKYFLTNKSKLRLKFVFDKIYFQVNYDNLKKN